ncbi:flavin-dependent oxidoreductase [Microtetraspora sp. NBRC 13810]|uniref:FAD-dependent monooxygenase n=1 Tax=Microtetraspora sp. NBRC 13810 TaxID=3030990 RepID=UPI0024A29098|nr:FAD-dependent monooxygenase [Microtetraspora sp. NBRC 13810]GLW06926.1 flavin-dependent oxidoreductase [Microtetraspora sp. NBRC 13810]
MPRILIAGAGIGGLTTALSLHAHGIGNVRVVEAAPAIRTAGVGLNLLPNAVRELAALDLSETLAAQGVSARRLAFYNRHGQLIWQEPRGLAAGHRWPQLSVHRADLLATLAAAVRNRLGAAALRTGARLTGCAPTAGGRVRAELAHPAGPPTVTEADILIGADGIRSTVRAALYPGEGPPPGNGMVMWRGTTWGEPFLTGDTMIVTGDDVRRVVLYPIRRDPSSGRVQINWVAARPARSPGRDDWNRGVPGSAVLAHFGDWRFDWLDIPAVLAAATEVYEYPMVDRDPLPRWTFGRMTLLGDAAHAMYPMGSNGATQAIVDAAVLARAVATHGDAAAALAAYENARRPPMTRLQASNRRMGPEIVISMAHRRAPDGFADVHDVIPAAELAAISARYAAAGGFDVDTVNNRKDPP